MKSVPRAVATGYSLAILTIARIETRSLPLPVLTSLGTMTVSLSQAKTVAGWQPAILITHGLSVARPTDAPADTHARDETAFLPPSKAPAIANRLVELQMRHRTER